MDKGRLSHRRDYRTSGSRYRSVISRDGSRPRTEDGKRCLHNSRSSCNAPPPRSPGDFVYEPVGRDPLGSTKKRIKYTAKRTIVIQTDRCAFKTQNSSLTRPFCSNRLLFGDDDGDDGDGRCGVVDFFIILLSPHVTTPQLTAFQHARGRMTPYRTTDRTYRRHYLKQT